MQTFLLWVLLFPAVIAGAQQHKVKPPNVQPPDQGSATKTPHKKGKETKVKIDPYTQDTLFHPIPIARQLFHDKIDKEQIAIDKMDGIADTVVTFKRDTSWSAALSYAVLDEIDAMQVMIENMPASGRSGEADNQQKIRYLRAVLNMLQRYRQDPIPDPRFYVHLVANMDSLLIAVNENKENGFAHTHTDIYTLDNSKDLFNTRPDIRAFLYIIAGKQFPVMIAKRLNEYADQDFAGDILADAAQIEPELIYGYATSTNIALKNAVYNTDDSLVQCIKNIVALSNSPLKALPFLGDLYYGRKTIKGIDSMTKDNAATFQNLVRLKLENDTIARHAYTADLKYRALNYVRKLDELHEEDSTARFSTLDSLPASSLYFLMVYGQDEIYTSSFLGTFRAMLARMRPMKGDQFLDSLHYDHFRTFIQMCAGYNTLSAFLATMDDNAKNALMTRFISGLGDGKDDDLEDAVDVANAFGSITDPTLLAFLQKKVQENYDLASQQGNKKGKAVYSILGSLIADNSVTGNDAGAETAAAKLHLPPINKVLYKDLVNDSGIVYQQLFFFGDKDGQDSYESFMDDFKNDKDWIIATFQDWTRISSVKGKKVVIYANLPHREPDDEVALNKLCQFLADSNIHPTIMIHRGHSYHLPVTLEKLTPDAKIVILGSCGGYNNLAAVLDHSPDAHIISSKQTGVRAVNEPIIKALNEDLLKGEDVDWITMWHDLGESFSKKPDVMERFADYVPPYKNLGAIFIKAYRKLMNN